MFSIKKIGNIIQSLHPNKAHGQDKISIPMMKIRGNSICRPLEILPFEISLLAIKKFFSLVVEKGKYYPNL